jgi:hypothetical protein
MELQNLYVVAVRADPDLVLPWVLQSKATHDPARAQEEAKRVAATGVDTAVAKLDIVFTVDGTKGACHFPAQDKDKDS